MINHATQLIKNLSLIIVLISISLILASHLFPFHQDKQELFDISYDLMQDIRAQIQEETQVIDFRKEAKPKEYLVQGWSHPDEHQTWANAKNFSVMFYQYDIKDLDFEMMCRAIPSKEGKKQLVSIFLNDKSIGSFIANPVTFQTIGLTIPSSSLRYGRNIMQFHCSYTATPSVVYQGSKDTRNLSVAFRSIRFKKDLLYSDEKGLLQHANSAFSVLSKLPKQFELSIQYQNSGDTTSFIELTNEAQKKISIVLSPEKKIYKKTISLEDKGIYKLRFVTDGSSNGYTLWSQIKLNMQKKEEGAQPINQNFPTFAKPDIFIYVIDALRADHLGCYGYQRKTSPNIDRFANENSLYRNAYSNSSWTKASAASILTGLFPKHHKTMARNDKLPDDVVTLAEKLQESGYYTVAFLGNGNLSWMFGFAQGFHEFKELFGEYPYSRHVQSDMINTNIFKFLKTYLKKKERKPLFMLVWTVDPHDPYTPERSVKDLFNIHQYIPINTYDFEIVSKIRSGKIQPTESQIEFIKTRYDQEIYFNDVSFGELLDTMKKHGIYDDSIVLFTSDHGEEFFDHGGVGHGRTLYNDQIKIPFIIKMGRLERGLHHERVQLIDIYPTIMDLLRLSLPYKLDGISLFRTVDPLRPLYFEEEHDSNDLDAVLDREKKLIYNKCYNRNPSKKSVPILELFAIEDVPEKNNLGFTGFADNLRLQELFSYRNNMREFVFQRKKIKIPPELDERLKALGYIN